MAAKKAKEPKTNGTPAPQAMQGAPVEVGGVTYKRKLITLPQLKFADGEQFVLRLEGAIHKSSVQGQKGRDGKPMEPADVCNVTNMLTGECATIICGTVLANKLRESYPEDGYVGRVFEIAQHKVEGKRWKSYSIAELESE